MLSCTACSTRTRPQTQTSTTYLLRTRPLLPAHVAIHFLIVLTPDARARRPPDNIFFLLFPRPLLLLLAFFPSDLHARQVLAVLVAEDVARGI